MTAANPNPCDRCGETVDCTPTGHHCPACGHHDDDVCDRTWLPGQEDTGPAGTIELPAPMFTALLTAVRCRNGFRYAATHTGVASPGLAALRELAAAYATGSRRLLPMTAYRLALAACDLAEDTWWELRDFLDPEVLAECDAIEAAERDAANAEYRAWRAEQSSAAVSAPAPQHTGGRAA